MKKRPGMYINLKEIDTNEYLLGATAEFNKHERDYANRRRKDQKSPEMESDYRTAKNDGVAPI